MVVVQVADAIETDASLLPTEVGRQAASVAAPGVLPTVWRVKGFVRFTRSPATVMQVDAVPGSVSVNAVDSHQCRDLGTRCRSVVAMCVDF
jgi:hypothetical protein